MDSRSLINCLKTVNQFNLQYPTVCCRRNEYLKVQRQSPTQSCRSFHSLYISANFSIFTRFWFCIYEVICLFKYVFSCEIK